MQVERKVVVGRLDPSESLLIDLQCFDLRVKGGLWNSKLGRRSARARYPPVTFGKRRFNHFALLSSQFLKKRLPNEISGGRRPREPTLVDRKVSEITDDYRALNHILQFAN